MPHKILIVDDEPDIRLVCNAVLKGAGYEVVTAKDGQDAIGKLESNGRYDLVITDGKMPNMDGIALLKYIKEKYPKTPVIVMSAMESYRDNAEKEGAIETLAKPFDNGGLTALVNTLLTPAASA